MPMHCEVLPIRQFGAFAPQWDALADDANLPAFLRAAFIGPALTHFGDGREQLALLRDSDRLVAAAVLQRGSRLGSWSTFQPSQLPLGAIALRPGVTLAGVADRFSAAVPGLCLRLGLTQLDPLFYPRPAAEPRHGTVDYIDTAWLDIDPPFDAYWESRGKNLRQNTRKQRNRLEAEGTTPQLDCLTDPGQVAQAVAEYGALESAGWKGESGSAVRPDNAQGRFYTEMLQAFCAAGHGRIYRLRFGDKVVAVDLCIDAGGVVVILKTAYDESYKAVSPSTLMRHDQFRHLFEEGRFSRIEFYGRVMEWHTRWTEQRRTLYHANVDRWRWLEGLRQRLVKVDPS